MMKKVRGFTLLELSIVIIIVVILAAIAIPNFLEGRGRPRISPVRADHRTLATAIETYFLDHKVYPAMQPLRYHEYAGDGLEEAGGWFLNTIHPGSSSIEGITTPIAYVTSVFPDPFAKDRGLPFAYYTDGPGWILISPGPDGDYDINKPHEVYDSSIVQPSGKLLLYAYDPTNGVDSSCDLFRVKQ